MNEPPSAIVQEASAAERVVVLKVRAPGRTSWVIVGVAGTTASTGLLPPEARKERWGGRLPPGSRRQRSREDALVGAHVLGIGKNEIRIDQRGQIRSVRALSGRIVVTDVMDPDAPPAFTLLDEESRARLEAAGIALVDALATSAIDVVRSEITRSLDKARTKISRRREAVRGDLQKIAEANDIASRASWFIAEAKRASRGANKLVVTDWSTGEPLPIEIALDPAKSASEQVEAMFKRAKRLRLGAQIAESRLAQTEAQLAAVTEAIAHVAEATSLPAMREAAHQAKKAAPRDVALPDAQTTEDGRTRAAKKQSTSGRRTPYRTFFARSGRKLLVGKGAADNDTLTLKVSRPHDLWLHAKDRVGAHVIAPLDKGQTCSSEDLVDAAHLAAHFSDARDEKNVDVQYTHRKYVRKPKGSGPGFVLVDREKVLVLRIDPGLLRDLLSREDETL
ncbi:MAG: NFACT RNA binding domain-containing protein [Polyangiaceae bacterium]|nr:NFACT RNA binding domain-containing protein [Polyangiaceae bacterium]